MAEKKIDLSRFREKFVLEAKNRISRMNEGLARLEKEPGDAKPEEDILLEAHTLKGAARMLGFSGIAELTQRFEETLARRGDRSIPPDREFLDSLFLALDTLARLVESLSQPPREAIDVKGVIDRLKSAESPDGLPTVPVPRPASAPPPEPPSAQQPPAEEGQRPRGNVESGTGTLVEPERLDALSNFLTAAISHQMRQADLKGQIDRLEKPFRRVVAELVSALQEGIRQGEMPPSLENRLAPLAEAGKSMLQDVFGRISDIRRRDIVEAELLAQSLEDMRTEILSIRMVPLSSLFDSLQPMGVSMAGELGKNIEILVRGGKTEIDRKVAEALAEPLSEILRNAVDHGIEPPAVRERCGKPATGTISITATPKKGRVVIEVEDDGKGIDPEEIRESAVRQGLVSEKAARGLDDRELMTFLFRDGFGAMKRGAGPSRLLPGLNVVRSVAEKFSGVAEASSVPGKGMRVVLELPFSMAVSHVILIHSGGQCFGIPAIHSDGIRHFTDGDVVMVEGRKSLRTEGAPVPLVWLNRLLDLPDALLAGDGYMAVMVRHSQQRMALVVDRVEGETEVVVRDLGKYLGKVQLFMGSTVIGTGDVVLLLDVYDLMSAVRMRPETVPENVGAGEARIADKDILLVEESRPVRESQHRSLVSAGYRVETVSDGRAALEMLSRKRFRVVVAGSRMQGMDGIELLSLARQSDPDRRTPVILVAPGDGRAETARAMAAGAHALVTREDVAQGRLTAMIGNILSRRER